MRITHISTPRARVRAKSRCLKPVAYNLFLPVFLAVVLSFIPRRNYLLHSYIFGSINRINLIQLLSQSRNFSTLKAPCSKNLKLRSWNCKMLYLSWPRKRLLISIISVDRTYGLIIEAHLKIISRKINKCHLIWINFAFMKVTSTFVTSVSAKGIPISRPLHKQWMNKGQHSLKSDPSMVSFSGHTRVSGKLQVTVSSWMFHYFEVALNYVKGLLNRPTA
jgi:hypothetical protein